MTVEILYWIIGIGVYLMMGVLNIRYCVGEGLAMVTYGDTFRAWLYSIWALLFWWLGPWALMPLAYIDEYVTHKLRSEVSRTRIGTFVYLTIWGVFILALSGTGRVVAIVFFLVQSVLLFYVLKNLGYRFTRRYRKQKPITSHMGDSDIATMYPHVIAPNFDDHGRQKP